MTKNVLIVDGDYEASRAAAKALEGEGYFAFTASSAEVGLMMAKRVRPSLVILNLGVKGAGGFDYMSKLRAVDNLKNVPVLLFAESGKEYDAGYLDKYGIVNFIGKPVDPVEVIQKSKASMEDIPAHAEIPGKEEVSAPEAVKPGPETRGPEPYESESYRETFERLHREEKAESPGFEKRQFPGSPLRPKEKKKLSKNRVFLGVLLVFFGAMASFGYFMLFRPARKAELAVSEQIAQMDGGIANTPAPAVANQPAIINSIKSSQSAQISNEISEVTGKTTSETKETLVSKPEREVKAPVEEAEKPAEKAAKRKENDHFYAVQVGVFSAKANAEKLAGKLKGEGYTAGVKKTEKGYRVLVGRFETGEKAEPLYKKLKMQGYQAVRYSE